MTRLGVSLVDPTAPPGRLAAVAADAELAGYTTLWTNEGPGRDAFATLAGWAATTHTARLAVGVAPLYVRPPVTAAAAAAGLSLVADRPVALGIGSGHPEVALRWFGTAYGSALAATADYAAIARALLSGGRVTVDGSEFATAGASLAQAPQRPVTVIIGATGPKMMQVAVESGDGVLVNWTPAGALGALAARLHDEAGPGFEVAAYIRVAAADDGSAAREELRRELARYLRYPVYRAHLDRLGHGGVAAAVAERWQQSDEVDAAAAAIPEEVSAVLGIAGTGAECRRQVEEYRRSGLDELVVRPVPVGSHGPGPAVAALAPSEGG